MIKQKEYQNHSANIHEIIFPTLGENLNKTYLEEYLKKIKQFLSQFENELPKYQNIESNLLKEHEKSIQAELEKIKKTPSIINNYRNLDEFNSNIIALIICFNGYKSLNTPTKESDDANENEIQELNNFQKFLEKKFPKCKSHTNDKLYICVNHLDKYGLMCYECSMDHTNKEIVNTHIYYFAPFRLASYMISLGKKILTTFENYKKINSYVDTVGMYPDLLNYNISFIKQNIYDEFNNIIQDLTKYRDGLIHRIEQASEHLVSKNDKKYQNIYSVSDDIKSSKENIYDYFHHMLEIFKDKLTKYDFDTNNLFNTEHTNLIEKNFIVEGKENEILKPFHNLINLHKRENIKNSKFPLSKIIPEFFSLSIMGADHIKSRKNDFRLTLVPCYDDRINIHKEKNKMRKNNDYYKSKLRLVSILNNIKSFSIENLVNRNLSRQDNSINQYDYNAYKIKTMNISVTVRDSIDISVNDNKLILPTEAALIEIDEHHHKIIREPKVIAIGGIYKTFNSLNLETNSKFKTFSNYISLLDVNSSTYYRNIFKLYYMNNRNVGILYQRIGVKAILLFKEEQKIFHKTLFTLYLFGGIGMSEQDKGIAYNDVFALDVDFIFIKNNQSLINLDTVTKVSSEKERMLPLTHVCNFEICEKFNNDSLMRNIPMFCNKKDHTADCYITNYELLKCNNKIYIFGGITMNGRILDSIIEFDPINNSYTTLSIYLPKNLFGFSLYHFKQFEHEKQNIENNLSVKDDYGLIFIIGGLRIFSANFKGLENNIENNNNLFRTSFEANPERYISAGIFSLNAIDLISNKKNATIKEIFNPNTNSEMSQVVFNKIKPGVTHHNNHLIICGGNGSKSNFYSIFDLNNHQFSGYFDLPLDQARGSIEIISKFEYLNNSSLNENPYLHSYNSFAFLKCIPSFN